jgi:hypothetical protein
MGRLRASTDAPATAVCVFTLVSSLNGNRAVEAPGVFVGSGTYLGLTRK